MTKNWLNQGKDHIWYPYTQMQHAPDPIKVIRTEGCYLHLEDGQKLLDGTASWWSACHGYNHPVLLAAAQQQLHTMPHVMFAGTAHEPAYRLAHRLSKLTGMEKVFFSDSGSTAVETAMKMAVQFWQNQGEKKRQKFISFEHGYHGDTMGAMSLCDPHGGMHNAFGHYMPKQYNVPIPRDEYALAELDELLHDIKENVAGMIIEPLVQGAGGMKFHSADILAELYRLCKKHQILFIADEVMTGFGRTGNMFACQEANITPDILCLGKALTAGMMTLSATLATQDIFDAFLGDELEKALMSGPTFMANPLACSIANASLDIFEQENSLEKVAKIEKQLYQALTPLKKNEKVIHVRVKGAIGVVEINTNWEEIFAMRQIFAKQGVWLRPFGNIIYIMPPFTITPEELNQLTDAVKAIMTKDL